MGNKKCEACGTKHASFGMAVERKKRWCGECSKAHGAVCLQAHNMCEGCGTKHASFGTPTERKKRWCGECGKAHGAVNATFWRDRGAPIATVHACDGAAHEKRQPRAMSLSTCSGVVQEELHPPPRKKRSYSKPKPRHVWTEQEHTAFVNALKLFGRDWARVTAAVGTKTQQQTRSHAQKHFKRIVRENTGEPIPPPVRVTRIETAVTAEQERLEAEAAAQAEQERLEAAANADRELQDDRALQRQEVTAAQQQLARKRGRPDSGSENEDTASLIEEASAPSVAMMRARSSLNAAAAAPGMSFFEVALATTNATKCEASVIRPPTHAAKATRKRGPDDVDVKQDRGHGHSGGLDLNAHIRDLATLAGEHHVACCVGASAIIKHEVCDNASAAAAHS